MRKMASLKTLVLFHFQYMVIALQLITKVLVYYWKTFIPKESVHKNAPEIFRLKTYCFTALERDRKKYNIQLKQMKDTEKKINTKYMAKFSLPTDIQLNLVPKNLKPRISTQESLLQFH